MNTNNWVCKCDVTRHKDKKEPWEIFKKSWLKQVEHEAELAQLPPLQHSDDEFEDHGGHELEDSDDDDDHGELSMVSWNYNAGTYECICCENKPIPGPGKLHGHYHNGKHLTQKKFQVTSNMWKNWKCAKDYNAFKKDGAPTRSTA